jgi:hypothetical protein
MALVQGYLFTYNIVQAAGWAVCLYYVVLGLLQQQGYKDIYDHAAPFASECHSLSNLHVACRRLTPPAAVQNFFKHFLSWRLSTQQQVGRILVATCDCPVTCLCCLPYGHQDTSPHNQNTREITSHTAAGWVKSSPVNNFMQWLGRSHAMFCICDAIATVSCRFIAAACCCA